MACRVIAGRQYEAGPGDAHAHLLEAGSLRATGCCVACSSGWHYLYLSPADRYVDEVNLLDDGLVDVVLDSGALLSTCFLFFGIVNSSS